MKSILEARIEQALKNIEIAIDNHNRWSTTGKFPPYESRTYNLYSLRTLLGKLEKLQTLEYRKYRAETLLRYLGNPDYEELTKMRLNGKIDGKAYATCSDSLMEAKYPHQRNY